MSPLLPLGKPDILVITGNWSTENWSIALNASKFITILLSLSNTVRCLSTNHRVEINHPHYSNFSLAIADLHDNNLKIIRHFLPYQLRIVRLMIRERSTFTITIFCFKADLFFIPIIFAKILGKRIVIRSDGRISFSSQSPLKRKLYTFMEDLVYSLADRIIVEDESLIEFYHFSKFRRKTVPGSLYVDTTKFRILTELRQRQYKIGYIGRFSKEKGINNFIESLKFLGSDYPVLLVGDGPLKGDVAVAVERFPNVCLRGWGAHDNIPYYLNEIQLLVFPSYWEGLPNLVLEAMACGTPVLATKVGAIPHLLADQVSGFILDSNDPESIADNILIALNYPYVGELVQNAKNIIQSKYTFGKVVENYKSILISQ